jgi:hypothetical protein
MHKNDVHRTKIGPARCSLVIYQPRPGRVVRAPPWRAVPVTGCPLPIGTVLNDFEESPEPGSPTVTRLPLGLIV